MGREPRTPPCHTLPSLACRQQRREVVRRHAMRARGGFTTGAGAGASAGRVHYGRSRGASFNYGAGAGAERVSLRRGAAEENQGHSSGNTGKDAHAWTGSRTRMVRAVLKHWLGGSPAPFVSNVVRGEAERRGAMRCEAPRIPTPGHRNPASFETSPNASMPSHAPLPSFSLPVSDANSFDRAAEVSTPHALAANGVDRAAQSPAQRGAPAPRLPAPATLTPLHPKTSRPPRASHRISQ